jgi:hypothetical protein
MSSLRASLRSSRRTKQCLSASITSTPSTKGSALVTWHCCITPPATPRAQLLVTLRYAHVFRLFVIVVVVVCVCVGMCVCVCLCP